MNVLQTILISLFLTPIVVYALLVVALGVPILRSSRWDVAFQRTGRKELDRRGLWHDTWSSTELSSVLSIVGADELEDVEDEVNVDHLAALDAIAGQPDITVGNLLVERRAMLVHFLRRQRVVSLRVARLRYLPKVWSVARFGAGVEVGARGVVWVLQKHAPVMKQLFPAPLMYSSVVGVIISGFFWFRQ